jgi:prevent-host-death family protein
MKRVGVAELKDQLSKHLRAVEAGDQVEVTDRDRAIARIIPVPGVGRLPIRPPLRPFSSVRTRRHQPAHWPVASIEMLREERQGR